MNKTSKVTGKVMNQGGLHESLVAGRLPLYAPQAEKLPIL